MNTRFEEKVSAALALGVISMVPMALVLLLFNESPATNRDILMALVGAIIANSTQAVQHRFGTNPGSQRKDDTINTLAQTARTAGESLAPLTAGGVVGNADITLKPGEVAVATATTTGTKIEKSPELPNGYPEWVAEQQAGGRTFASTQEALEAFKKEVLGE